MSAAISQRRVITRGEQRRRKLVGGAIALAVAGYASVWVLNGWAISEMICALGTAGAVALYTTGVKAQ